MKNISYILFLTIFLASCSGSGKITPTSSPTTHSSMPPTATVVWFPTTPAPTILPSNTPTVTVNPKPGIQDAFLKEDFSEALFWNTGKSEAGSVAVANNELTIALSAPKSMLYAFRKSPETDNFFLEVTASPSLCRGDDSYGISLRGSSNINTYRLLISCSGKIRFDRVRNNSIVPIQDWMYSGQVPPGSPLSIRVGVWAVRREFRIFINDMYQFSATDNFFSSGKIGFFARSAGNSALTVNFSDLVVKNVSINELQFTATPTRVITATRTPVIITPPSKKP